MDPAGLAAGRPPGGRSEECRAPGPAKPARLSLIPGAGSPRSNTNFGPARSGPSRTRIQQPASGKPRAHQIVWEPGKVNRSRRMRANPADIWVTWRLAAFEPPGTPPSVV